MKLWRYGLAIEQLGLRYRLERPLGSGGMADVCLAWDEQEQRSVAIKVIKSDNLDQRSLDRFLKETAQIVRLDHPHILRVYSHLNLELLDVSHGSIVPYIVMECAQGGDLQKRLLSNQPYNFAAALSIFAQIGSAVQYAHEQGVIHRDLKPHNILFRTLATGGEQAVLSDFGLAVEITATHHTFASGGTLAYMAPEQFRGQAQAASDTFSLAVVLYQLLTGMLPFRRSLSDLVTIDTPPPPMPASTLNPEVPAALDAVLLTALASDPTERQASAGLFVELVKRAAGTNPVGTRFIASASASARTGSLSTAPKWLTASGSPRQNSGGTTRPMAASPFDVSDEVITDPGDPGAHHSSLKNASHDSIIQLPPETQHSGRDRSSASASRLPSTPRQPSTSAVPATPAQPSTPPIVPAPPVARKRRALLTPRNAAALLLLASLLIGLTYFGLSSLRTGSSTTRVTLTPSSYQLSDLYPIVATTGSPDATQLQAHALTASAQSPQQTVNATGQGQTPGTRAIGTLIFSNGSGADYTVTANTIISGSSGVSVALDSSVTIPAADVNTGKLGTASGHAHAVNAGAAGNIPGGDISRTCCDTAANVIFVKNTNAFTGGQDAASYTVVRQSDITQVSAGATAGLVDRARGELKGQVKAGERVADSTVCTPLVQTDHQAGERATALKVQVTVSCTELVYETGPLPQLVTRKLAQQAQAQIGPDFASYALVDSQGRRTDQAAVTNITFKGVDFAAGTVSLQVQASATWVYQVSDQQIRQIKGLIAHRSPTEVQARLKGQAGVMRVDISLNNGTQLGSEDQIAVAVAVVRGQAGMAAGSGGGDGGTPVIGPPTVGPLGG